MARPVCLCAGSPNQNKTFDGGVVVGARFLCGGGAVPPPSLRAVLPAPAPFSSPFNHCLFTLSQELNEARLGGSPWEAPQAPPCPAFPIYPHRTPIPPCLPAHPPTTPPQQIAHSHTNTAEPPPWESLCPLPLPPTTTADAAASYLRQIPRPFFFFAISCSLRQTWCAWVPSAAGGLRRREL